MPHTSQVISLFNHTPSLSVSLSHSLLLYILLTALDCMYHCFVQVMPLPSTSSFCPCRGHPPVALVALAISTTESLWRIFVSTFFRYRTRPTYPQPWSHTLPSIQHDTNLLHPPCNHPTESASSHLYRRMPRCLACHVTTPLHAYCKISPRPDVHTPHRL